MRGEFRIGVNLGDAIEEGKYFYVDTVNVAETLKISGFSVISRSSSGIDKGKQVKEQEVGRELEVGYVPEGSVQELGGRVRFTAQPIDAAEE